MPTPDTATFNTLLERVPFTLQQLAHRLHCDPSTVYRWKRGECRPHPAAVEYLRLIAEANTHRHAGGQFRFIDLFAGIGGMRLGVEAAGGRCVYTCEWNKFSRQTYAANFKDGPEHRFDWDITKVEPASVPEHDLLVAGFPCQPFSIAGVSKKNALGRPHGFACEEQGNLFFRIADILAVKRPPAFLLENVRNLERHDKGRTFTRIMDVLRDELGYEVHHRVINAKGWVPQNRERILIVGFREPTKFSFEDLKVPDPNKGPKLSTILHPENGEDEPEEPPYTEGDLAQVASKYILTRHLWDYLRAYAQKHADLGHGFGYGLVKPSQTARTLSARYFKDGSEILIHRGKGKRPRRLTPRECSRLMGFDRRGGQRFEIPVSDTQAYKQFGNAVVVPMVEAVAKHLTPHLLAILGGEQLPLPELLPAANA